MPPNSDDFADLIERTKQGDRQATAQLVTHYEVELLAFSRVHLGALLRPYLDSVDLVQSVHRSVLAGLRNDKFDISTPEKLIGLAFTMVRRKVARQWQRSRRQIRREGPISNDEDLSQLLLSLCDRGSDPAEIASIRDQIEQVLNACSAADRRLLRLRIDGYSTVEAARELGMDPDVSRVRLSRLRRRLRRTGIATDLF